LLLIRRIVLLHPCQSSTQNKFQLHWKIPFDSQAGSLSSTQRNMFFLVNSIILLDLPLWNTYSSFENVKYLNCNIAFGTLHGEAQKNNALVCFKISIQKLFGFRCLMLSSGNKISSPPLRYGSSICSLENFPSL